MLDKECNLPLDDLNPMRNDATRSKVFRWFSEPKIKATASNSLRATRSGECSSSRPGSGLVLGDGHTEVLGAKTCGFVDIDLIVFSYFQDLRELTKCDSFSLA